MNWSFTWGFIAGALSVVVIGAWHLAGQITEKQIQKDEKERKDATQKN